MPSSNASTELRLRSMTTAAAAMKAADRAHRAAAAAVQSSSRSPPRRHGLRSRHSKRTSWENGSGSEIPTAAARRERGNAGIGSSVSASGGTASASFAQPVTLTITAAGSPSSARVHSGRAVAEAACERSVSIGSDEGNSVRASEGGIQGVCQPSAIPLGAAAILPSDCATAGTGQEACASSVDAPRQLSSAGRRAAAGATAPELCGSSDSGSDSESDGNGANGRLRCSRGPSTAATAGMGAGDGAGVQIPAVKQGPGLSNVASRRAAALAAALCAVSATRMFLRESGGGAAGSASAQPSPTGGAPSGDNAVSTTDYRLPPVCASPLPRGSATGIPASSSSNSGDGAAAETAAPALTVKAVVGDVASNGCRTGAASAATSALGAARASRRISLLNQVPAVTDRRSNGCKGGDGAVPAMAASSPALGTGSQRSASGEVERGASLPVVSCPPSLDPLEVPMPQSDRLSEWVAERLRSSVQTSRPEGGGRVMPASAAVPLGQRFSTGSIALSGGGGGGAGAVGRSWEGANVGLRALLAGRGEGSDGGSWYTRPVRW